MKTKKKEEKPEIPFPVRADGGRTDAPSAKKRKEIRFPCEICREFQVASSLLTREGLALCHACANKRDDDIASKRLALAL